MEAQAQDMAKQSPTSNDTVEVFWVVARDLSTLHCSKRQPSFTAAHEEAKWLAAKEHSRFFVLEVVGAAVPETPTIVWQDAAPVAEHQEGEHENV